MQKSIVSRREFLASGAASLATLAVAGKSGRAAEKAAKAANRQPLCVFVKYLQSLSFEELAAEVDKLGFSGIEATVRKNGQILPAEAEERLPQLVAALRERNLEVTIMTTDLSRADDPLTERVLRTAASLGIKRYRMNYYRYDLSQPVIPQLRELKPVVKDLAALNRELGIQGLYQNHAGAAYVGASLWDLERLLEGIPREDLGIAFDIRHATVEGGTTWPVLWNLVQPHLGAVYIKDAWWEGRKIVNGPLGTERGVVDPRFFKLLRESDFSGPISLHVEYLDHGSVPEQLQAIESNLATLKSLL